MYEAIKKYCDGPQENGLFLLDMPTGYGKTYSVLQYIYEAAMLPENSDRKFFFVTTLKKNLPKEELFKKFKDEGHEKEFEEKFLFIDSNVDSVLSGWSKQMKADIPFEIKNSEEYTAFIQDVEFIQQQQTSGDKNLIKVIEDNLRKNSEPKFRRYIQALLFKKFSTVEQRIYAIKTDKEWQWLAKIYPSVFTREKQIIFMSMDRFLVRNSTIVEPSYMFYNSNLINHAIVFIDEFDATKETALKNIIQNGLRDRVDYIELFNNIYAALHLKDFPTVLTIPSEQRKRGEYKDQNLQDVIEDIRKLSDDVYKKYNLRYTFRTASAIDDTPKNFLFQDHQFHNVLSDNNSYISIVNDSKKRLNSICFTKNKPETDKANIQVMLGNLRGFISRFQTAIYILALNYMQYKNENRKNGDDEFTLESAIRSVLAEFQLPHIYVEYLTSQILISSKKQKGNIQEARFDLSLYENGFRYYAFENDTEHDMQSKIMMCAFQTTPEKILLRFCEKAKVIGISATATSPSVIGNYDLEYLRSKLQDKYILPTEVDKNRMKKDFEEKQKGYANVQIHAELLGETGIYSEKSWQNVFNNTELAQYFYEQIETTLGGTDNTFHQERYLRIALAFKRFVEHKDIQSFLCVLTKYPKLYDKQLDRRLLDEIFKNIILEQSSRLNLQKCLFYLTGEDFDSNKEELMKRLQDGEKIFVISVYQTIGAGQNLQYPIPQKLQGKLVQTNSYASRGEKDFDAIYLDKPSHILALLRDNLPEEDFVKYIFQMEFLQEHYEISSTETRESVKRAFACYMNEKIRYSKTSTDAYKCQSVLSYATRNIIQAIGRMCRTNQKRSNIYIYVDNRIADSLDVEDCKKRLLNKEFEKLLSVVKLNTSCSPEEKPYTNAAELISVKSNKYIGNMLREDWTGYKMEDWKILRELVLKAPTMSQEEVDKTFIAKNFYIRLPKKANYLYYAQEQDYNKVEVSFKKQSNMSIVSSEAAKLDAFMKIPKVKSYFEKQGWATTFKENDYILSPTLFNNIYKGALGEAVGKFLLETCGVKIDEIPEPELFELFDFKVSGKPIYIDFKNWHEDTEFSEKEILAKIAKKAEKCKSHTVFIINILAKKKWPIHRKKINDIQVVIIPSLVIDGQRIECEKDSWQEIRRQCKSC